VGHRISMVQPTVQSLWQRQALEATAGHVANDLADVVAELPTRQRAAVILRYYEGRSENEIAEILQCRPGTVKSLLSRALHELQRVTEK
jgi:RNA polymerase sigma factor (sigma-70 family)